MNLRKIVLRGAPYVKGDLSKQDVRESLAVGNYDIAQILQEPKNREILEKLKSTPLRNLNVNIKEGADLTFEEAFLGMVYVLTATNPLIKDALTSDIQQAHGYSENNPGAVFDDQKALAMGTSFLDGMAIKESLKGLSPQEIAGMVAAAYMDVVCRVPLQECIDTCGMGGDKGFRIKDEKRKTINASTLSGIVLASLGKRAFKHGSYSNTSAVGSTDALEKLGANLNQKSLDEILDVFGKTNFHYSDAHLYKTVHDLSHLLKFETVNHIVGPMTTPVSADTTLHRVIGVNHKIHPRDVAKAYAILNERGFQKVGNVAVVSGLDQDYKNIKDMDNFAEVKPHMLVDEISPYATLLGIVQNGKYVGCFMVKPEDFGVELEEDKIMLKNTEEVLTSMNCSAITGKDKANADYLAINAALNLFVCDYLGKEDAILNGNLNRTYLSESYQRCREAICSGKAVETLKSYVLATGGKPIL